MFEDEKIQDIAKGRKLKLVIMFGSRVKGLVRPDSDVDIGVLTESGDGLSSGDFLDLQAELQDVFPGAEVDLAVLDHADPLFLKQVVEGGRLLAGARRAFQELKIYAFKRYQDHKPYLEMEARFAERFVAERTASP